jgi:hypothetical protein
MLNWRDLTPPFSAPHPSLYMPIRSRLGSVRVLSSKHLGSLSQSLEDSVRFRDAVLPPLVRL